MKVTEIHLEKSDSPSWAHCLITMEDGSQYKATCYLTPDEGESSTSGAEVTLTLKYEEVMDGPHTQ